MPQPAAFAQGSVLLALQGVLDCLLHGLVHVPENLVLQAVQVPKGILFFPTVVGFPPGLELLEGDAQPCCELSSDFLATWNDPALGLSDGLRRNPGFLSM